MVQGFFVLISAVFILYGLGTYFAGEHPVKDNLVKYGKTEEGTEYFYDKDSIERKSGIVKIWTETRFTKKNNDWSEMVDICKNSGLNSIQDCESLSFTKEQLEINCTENAFHSLLLLLYDEHIYNFYSKSNRIESTPVVPNSVIEDLKDRVCK